MIHDSYLNTKFIKGYKFSNAEHQLLLSTFGNSETVLQCSWYTSYTIACQIFTKKGQYEAKNVLMTQGLPTYSIPHSSGPNGTDLWYSGGISPTKLSHDVNASFVWILQEHVTTIR